MFSWKRLWCLFVWYTKSFPMKHQCVCVPGLWSLISVRLLNTHEFLHVCFIVVADFLDADVILGVHEGLGCGVGFSDGDYTGDVLKIIGRLHFYLSEKQTLLPIILLCAQEICENLNPVTSSIVTCWRTLRGQTTVLTRMRFSTSCYHTTTGRCEGHSRASEGSQIFLQCFPVFINIQNTNKAQT